MPLVYRSFLCLAALLTVMWSAAAQTPTSVRQPVGDVYVDAQGVLRYQQNKQEVALFGVNYTAPCVECVELPSFCGMVLEAVHCSACAQPEAVCRHGKTRDGRQRCRCTACRRTFQLRYHHHIHEPGTRQRITDMALNGGGVRDTARVLGISPQTVMGKLKKLMP